MSNSKYYAGMAAGLFAIYCVLDVSIRLVNELVDVFSRGV